MRTKTGQLVRLASWKQSISHISLAIFFIVLFAALCRVNGGEDFPLKKGKGVPVPPAGSRSAAPKPRPQPVIRSAGVIEQEKALILSSERDLELVKRASVLKLTSRPAQAKPAAIRHLKGGIYVVESGRNEPSAGLADLPPQIGRVRRRTESLRPIVAEALRAPSMPARRKLFSVTDRVIETKPKATLKTRSGRAQTQAPTSTANPKTTNDTRPAKKSLPGSQIKSTTATNSPGSIQLATFEENKATDPTEPVNKSTFPVAGSSVTVASDYRLPAPTTRPRRAVASPAVRQAQAPPAPEVTTSKKQEGPASAQFSAAIEPADSGSTKPPLVAQPIPRSAHYANSFAAPQPVTPKQQLPAAPKQQLPAAPKQQLPFSPMTQAPADPTEQQHPFAPMKQTAAAPTEQQLPNVIQAKPETLSPGAGVKVQQLPSQQYTQPIAQPAAQPPAQPAAPTTQPPAAAPAAQPKKGNGPLYEVVDESEELQLQVRRSKILRTKGNVYRTAVVDPQICDVVHFTPREVSVIGKSQGATHVTFWFEGGPRPVTFLVRVVPDPVETEKVEQEYSLLEEVVADLFPDSKVRLVVVADKLIVSGQAKDNEEAAQIMAIVRSRAVQPGGQTTTGITRGGQAARVLSAEATGRQSQTQLQVINMLRVPGVHQVALRVKIAELNRSAARGFGVDVDAAIDLTPGKSSTLFLQSMLNVVNGEAPSLLTQFDGDDIQIGIRWLQQHGVLRLLSEPTLVTMSGRPATFVAGGEFAVPTVVGTAGLNAVTTDFRAFGVIISFMPTVVDKDRIRLQVSPEFSQINSSLNVNNTPGLNVRAVTTTVEMREGQTLAIAGLLEDTLQATKVGDLPVLSKIFGRRDVSRNETELIILVTPELIHPMQPEEVPPLPGFDVTEPSNMEFYLQGRLEGAPTQEYRSTVWPRLKRRYGTNGPAMISGPFGHGQ